MPQGAEIWDAAGKRYLDAAGGAIVINVGHGRESVARVMADQAARIAYAHGSAFTSEPLEAYAAEVGPFLPLDEPAIYPVSGGSEAIESALKMARAYHVARGEPDRQIVIGRWGSYHGNTLGALDLSGRQPLRRPYEGWLGRFRHVSAAYPYRAGEPDAHALGSAEDAAAELDRVIATAGPTSVCAFVAEPIVGATLGVVSPPPGYWPAIAEVCRRYGVLLIADEVMTGFGRTGRWFAMERFGVRPDILVAAKGATGGYWPFGFAAADRSVYDVIQRKGVFVHGFTFSHSVVGAAVAREVLRILREEDLVAASARQGRAAAGGAARRVCRAPQRRRGARDGTDGRGRAGGGPRYAGAVRPCAPGHRAHGRRGPGPGPDVLLGHRQRERRGRRRHHGRPAVRGQRRAGPRDREPGCVPWSTRPWRGRTRGQTRGRPVVRRVVRTITTLGRDPAATPATAVASPRG